MDMFDISSHTLARLYLDRAASRKRKPGLEGCPGLRGGCEAVAMYATLWAQNARLVTNGARGKEQELETRALS